VSKKNFENELVMSEETQKPRFSEFQLKEFVHLFEKQNWRLREIKEGYDKRKLLTAEEAWKSVLGLESEEEFQALFDFAIEDIGAKHGVCYAVAKCMQYDNLKFEDAIKNFWFGSKFGAVKGRINRIFKEQTKWALEAEAAKKLGAYFEDWKTHSTADGHFYEVDVDINYNDSDGNRLRQINVQKLTGEIPARLLNCADLLGKDDFSEKPARTSVAYRLRTDCAEIVKLASAACDISATEFVENLILEASQIFVRGNIGAARAEIGKMGHASMDAAKKVVDLQVSQELYKNLADRYGNATNKGYFPHSSRDLPIKGGALSQGKRWWPVDEEPEEPQFEPDTTRAQAIEWIHAKLTNARRLIQTRTNALGELCDLLGEIRATPDNQIGAVMNRFVNGKNKAQTGEMPSNEADNSRKS
jgi:hypothetical protein